MGAELIRLIGKVFGKAWKRASLNICEDFWYWSKDIKEELKEREALKSKKTK
jgi:hypothetical protein